MKHKPFVILAILVLIFLSTQSNSPIVEPTPTAIAEAPERLEDLEGQTVCLPHRDTSGPITLECAIGFQSGEEYYSIDTNLLASMKAGELVRDTGNSLRISGVFTPIEELSSDHWQKYDIEGIISATSVTTIE